MATTAALAGGIPLEQDEDVAADGSTAPVSRSPWSRRSVLLGLGAALLIAALAGLGLATYFGAFDSLLERAGIRTEAPPGTAEASASRWPIFFDLPDIVVDLSTSNGETRMLRASIALEVVSPKDVAFLKALMPLILDALQTRLRALSANDLKGTAQYYRLREELLRRVEFAIGPGHVRQVFFLDLLVR